MDPQTDRGSSTPDHGRSSTPNKLPKNNCSQCYLLKEKIRSSNSRANSSVSSQRSQRSSRSNTPDYYFVNCNHSTNGDSQDPILESSFRHSPTPILMRKRDRFTGKLLLPSEEQHQQTFKPQNLFTGQSTSRQSNVEENSLNHDTIETEFISNDDDSIDANLMISNDENQRYLKELHSSPKKSTSDQQESTKSSETNRINPLIGKMFGLKTIIICHFLACSFLALFWFNRIQPKEFIDEQFHLRQTRSYCQGNFTQWDNKITTPPGLYLISFFLFKLFDFFGKLTPWISCGSLTTLRFVNILFSCGNFMLFNEIFRHNFKASLVDMDDETISLKSKLSSLSLTYLPPLFMFNFLYYTDAGSIFFTTLMYYYHLVHPRQHWKASICGFISLWFRQTNIVWIFFLASLHAVNVFGESYHQHYEYRKAEFGFGLIRMRFRLYQRSLTNPYYLVCFLLDWFFCLCRQIPGYILNGLAFVIFIYWNQGIVLGDRSAHKPVLHFAQIPYFLTFVLLFAWPLLLTKKNLRLFLNQSISNPSWFLLTTMFLANCLSSQFTYQHPYLLADNRHYVFYLWRKFWFHPEWPSLRYLPLPLYSFTLISMWNMVNFASMDPFKEFTDHKKFIRKNCEKIRKILLFLLITMVIVPQSLIEFRYFLTPYIIWRLNVVPFEQQQQDEEQEQREDEIAKSKKDSLKTTTTTIDKHDNNIRIIIELIWALAINLITFIIFHKKTFKHPDGSIQRIIW